LRYLEEFNQYGQNLIRKEVKEVRIDNRVKFKSRSTLTVKEELFNKPMHSQQNGKVE